MDPLNSTLTFARNVAWSLAYGLERTAATARSYLEYHQHLQMQREYDELEKALRATSVEENEGSEEEESPPPPDETETHRTEAQKTAAPAAPAR